MISMPTILSSGSQYLQHALSFLFYTLMCSSTYLFNARIPMLAKYPPVNANRMKKHIKYASSWKIKGKWFLGWMLHSSIKANNATLKIDVPRMMQIFFNWKKINNNHNDNTGVFFLTHLLSISWINICTFEKWFETSRPMNSNELYNKNTHTGKKQVSGKRK